MTRHSRLALIASCIAMLSLSACGGWLENRLGTSQQTATASGSSEESSARTSRSSGTWSQGSSSSGGYSRGSSTY